MDSDEGRRSPGGGKWLLVFHRVLTFKVAASIEVTKLKIRLNHVWLTLTIAQKEKNGKIAGEANGKLASNKIENQFPRFKQMCEWGRNMGGHASSCFEFHIGKTGEDGGGE